MTTKIRSDGQIRFRFRFGLLEHEALNPFPKPREMILSTENLSRKYWEKEIMSRNLEWDSPELVQNSILENF